MTTVAAMNRFLADVENKAFHMAKYAVRDTDEALDIVQDSMFTLARKYSDKTEDQWRPLFFRILQNRIRDWHRRSKVKQRLFASHPQGVEEQVDPIAQAPAAPQSDPAYRSSLDGATDQLQVAVEGLPARQQQAFLLRTLEGLSVAETAKTMRCSQGSVKTHYSRALHSLRQTLKEHWQ